MTRSLLYAVSALLLTAVPLGAMEVHVAPNGDDTATATATHPVGTLAAAQRLVRAERFKTPSEPVRVLIHAGVYYLPETLAFTELDSGTATAPVVYTAAGDDQVVISGGMRLKLTWVPYRDGIMQANVPAGTTFDQLFINDKRQRMARYPNADPAVSQFEGYAADAISPERVARWKDPAGGFIHAMHGAEWGGYSYLITGKSADGKLIYEGGWQNNRPSGMHQAFRMVENIFEELDAPGEWFLDKKQSRLYYFPEAGLDLANAVVEGARLPQVIDLRGSQAHPVCFLTLDHLIIRHAARTFMENKEPLLRGDWTCYRGGAVLVEGAEDCAIRNCWFDQVGGNAIFISRYNRRVQVTSCHINQSGGNGVSVVGDPKAVRNPLFNADQRQDLSAIDRTPGPKTDDYPADCLIDDCLIHGCGRFEKQTAPIDIDMATRITVRDCSLYDTPRAGLNIGDGCWGGDVIEGCDIFDTVLETGDNGSFNSWGRDRYWSLGGVDLNAIVGTPLAGLPLLDVVAPNIIRHNRWRCDHGWDIDLDDGSSNYQITNNVCLNGGLKLREGFHRLVENNIMVGCGLHVHVWFKDSEDIIRHNIVGAKYAPIGMPSSWGKTCDYNLLNHSGVTAGPAKILQGQSGQDEHSIEADALFLDAAKGDYRVPPTSPAIALGFVSFPTDHFGVRSPWLRALARQPRLPGSQAPAGETPISTRDERIVPWLGAEVKNLVGLGEVSATGSSGENGVLVKEIPAGSPAVSAGLKQLDVIRSVAGARVDTVADLLRAYGRSDAEHPVALGIWHAQHESTVTVPGGKEILLSPGTATLNGEGSKPVFSGGDDYLGAWGNEHIDIVWNSVAVPAGTYEVVALVGVPKKDAGSTFSVQVGQEVVKGVVPDTGDWNRFSALPLGKVVVTKAPAEGTTVTLHPLVRMGVAVMNLRAVVLLPR